MSTFFPYTLLTHVLDVVVVCFLKRGSLYLTAMAILKVAFLNKVLALKYTEIYLPLPLECLE